MLNPKTAWSEVAVLTCTCRVLSVELPGTVVFDYPTIGALAEFAATLTQHAPPQHASSAAGLVPAPAVDRALASYARSALNHLSPWSTRLERAFRALKLGVDKMHFGCYGMVLIR